VEILHFCSGEAWASAQQRGEYRTPNLATEGFIHCSTADQVHVPANALVRGRTDLVLLTVETEFLDHQVRWEPGDPSDPQSTRFPHVYGPIPLAAVTAVRDFRPLPDGTFTMPSG